MSVSGNLEELDVEGVVIDGLNAPCLPTAHISTDDVCCDHHPRLTASMSVANSDGQPASLTSDYHSGHFDLSPPLTDSSPATHSPNSRSYEGADTSSNYKHSSSGHGSDLEAVENSVLSSLACLEAGTARSFAKPGCQPSKSAYHCYRRRRMQDRDHSRSFGNLSPAASSRSARGHLCPLSRNCWSSTSSFSVSTSSFFSEDGGTLFANDASVCPEDGIGESISSPTISQSMSALQLVATTTPDAPASRAISSSSLRSSVLDRSRRSGEVPDSAWSRTCSTVPQRNGSAHRKLGKWLHLSPSLSTPEFSSQSQSYSSIQGKWKERASLERSVDTSRDSVFSPDSFARAIKPTYQYLMRARIMSPDTAQYDSYDKINDELTWDTTDVPELGPSRHHNYSSLCLQYKCLTEWLDSVSASLYMCAKSSVGRSFRQSLVAEMDQKRLQRHLFNERCRHLLKTRPDLETEITDRFNEVEQRWTKLTADIDSSLSETSNGKSDNSEKAASDERSELATLDSWLHRMEEHLKPVSFRCNRFTSTGQLNQTLADYKALVEDIKSRQSAVNKLKHLPSHEAARATPPPASHQLQDLDQRWLKLLLCAHEWVYYLENCATVQSSSESSDSSCEDYCVSGDCDHLEEREGCSFCGSLSADSPPPPSPSVSAETSEISDSGSFIEDDYLMDTSKLDITSSSTNHNTTSSSTPKSAPSSLSSPSSRSSAITLKMPLTSTPTASVPVSNSDSSRSTVLAYDLEPPDRGYSSNNSACGNSGESEGELLPARAAVNSSNVRCEVVKALDDDADEEVEDGGSERLSDSSLSSPNSDRAPRPSEENVDLPLSATSVSSPLTSSFSVSDRRADNLATFYFRHVESPTFDDCAHFRPVPDTSGVAKQEDHVSASAYAAAILNRRWYSASSDGEDVFVDADVLEQFEDDDDAVDIDADAAVTVDTDTGIDTRHNKTSSDADCNLAVVSTEFSGDYKLTNPDNDDRFSGNNQMSLNPATPTDQGTAQKFKWWTAHADSLVRQQQEAGGISTMAAGNVIRHGSQSTTAALGEGSTADKPNLAAATLGDRHCRAVRVRSWLRKHHSRAYIDRQGDNSCDASSEATSDAECGDADCGNEQDGSCRSLGSDDLSSSLATCQEMASVCTAQTLSAKAVSNQSSPLKFRSRGVRRRNTQRPWSLHLPKPISGYSGSHSLSVSETALNQVSLASGQSRTVGAAGAALSSSVGARLSKPSPARWAGRRQSRMQQPIRNESTDSGGGSSASGHAHRRARRRSLRSLTSAVVSNDLMTGHVTKSQSFCSADALRENVSPSDDSSDRSETGVKHSEANHSDSDVLQHRQKQEHSELCDMGHTEELSSMSEQAWDHYQEYKVINELDSEGSADPDATRHLLECDDYRKFLDSQPEDCASSQLSGRNSTALYRRTSKTQSGSDSPTKSSTRRLRRKARIFLPDHPDSDSDSNGANSTISRLLLDSRGNLHALLDQIDKSTSSDSAEFFMAAGNQCVLEVARLEEAIALLQSLKSRDAALFLGQLAEVVEQWRLLQQRAAEKQRQADALSRLHGRCADLRSRLTGVETELTSLTGSPGQLNSIEQVTDRIAQIKEVQGRLSDCCQGLASVNADVHRHTKLSNSIDKEVASSHTGVNDTNCADNGSSDAETCQSQNKLKKEVTLLYLLVEKISERLNGSLVWLESLHEAWSRYLSATEQVQAALEQDRQLLACLQRQTADSASSHTHSQSGHTHNGRYLSDADREQLHQLSSLLDLPNQNRLLSGSYGLSGSRDDLSSEGTSGYDSACSEEMNTHARRVSRLGRLASRLQTLLPPRSAAYSEVQHTISSASAELQSLQLTCNKLITMTSFMAVDESVVAPATDSTIETVTVTPSTVPVSQCKRPMSWLRRVFRTALPFQLVLLVCVCAACLLEPTCSGSACRFHWSFVPELRYLNGPPPI